MHGRSFLAVLSLVALGVPGAQADPAALCRQAAATASGETGVPQAILSTILLAESGRRSASGMLEPWPWTLHAEGRGLWFDSAAAARKALTDMTAAGVTNIDIGCFQINLHWHGASYPAPDALLDPMANALHAARFLADLHAASGDWRIAAGRYHSRDPQRAETYVRKLEALHSGQAPADIGPAITEPEPLAATEPEPRAQAGVLIDFGRRLRPMFGALP